MSMNFFYGERAPSAGHAYLSLLFLYSTEAYYWKWYCAYINSWVSSEEHYDYMQGWL